jgi:protein O-mannosyl-transferase
MYRETIARNPACFMAHNNLGTAVLRQGRTEEAIAQLNTVLRLQPNYEVVYYNLGLALLRLGREDEALGQFQNAVDLKPDYGAAHNNLANLFRRKGQPAAAIEHYRLAARFRPKNADIASNLAWLLDTCPDASLRNSKEALQQAQRAERLSAGVEPVHLATLAAAYAETGHFPEAMFNAQRALQMASAQGKTALAEALQRQIALYAEGKPFRDIPRNNPLPTQEG